MVARMAERARPCSVVDPADELVLAADHDLGGGRRRGRAQVGDEVGNRHVGFVADGRDHRHRAGGNRPGDDFLVEGPQVFDRAAAASGDDDIHAGHGADQPQSARNLAGRALALHARGRNHQVRVGIAAPQHPDDVAQRRAVARGDDADAPRAAPAAGACAPASKRPSAASRLRSCS